MISARCLYRVQHTGHSLSFSFPEWRGTGRGLAKMGEAEEREVRDRQAPGGKDNDLLRRRHPKNGRQGCLPHRREHSTAKKEVQEEKKRKDRKKRATGNNTRLSPDRKVRQECRAKPEFPHYILFFVSLLLFCFVFVISKPGFSV